MRNVKSYAIKPQIARTSDTVRIGQVADACCGIGRYQRTNQLVLIYQIVSHPTNHAKMVILT